MLVEFNNWQASHVFKYIKSLVHESNRDSHSNLYFINSIVLNLKLGYYPEMILWLLWKNRDYLAAIVPHSQIPLGHDLVAFVLATHFPGVCDPSGSYSHWNLTM